MPGVRRQTFDCIEPFGAKFSLLRCFYRMTLKRLVQSMSSDKINASGEGNLCFFLSSTSFEQPTTTNNNSSNNNSRARSSFLVRIKNAQIPIQGMNQVSGSGSASEEEDIQWLCCVVPEEGTSAVNAIKSVLYVHSNDASGVKAGLSFDYVGGRRVLVREDNS